MNPLRRPSSDRTKGQAISSQVSCRLPYGRRYPRQSRQPHIAGQHADYLAKQLHEFKSGKRKNSVMSGMAAPLTDDDISATSPRPAAQQGLQARLREEQRA